MIIISKEARDPRREMRLCDHFTVTYILPIFILQIYSNFYYINNTLWTFYSQISFVFKFGVETFVDICFLNWGSTTAPQSGASSRAPGWTTSWSGPASVCLDLRSCRLQPPGNRPTPSSRLRPAPGQECVSREGRKNIYFRIWNVLLC